MEHRKILIWYLDNFGETRIQLVDLTHGYEIQTLLYEFSMKDGVKNILEAYTVSEIHSIHEKTWTEGFYVETESCVSQ